MSFFKRNFLNIFSYLFSPLIIILVKNSAKLFFSDSWIYAISFLQAILVARFLGVEKYGLLALITAYVTLVNQVVDFRVKETVVKYTSEFMVKKDKERILATIKLCYLIDLSTGILAFLIVVFTAKFVSIRIMHHSAISNLIILYSIILLVQTVDGTCYGVISAFEKFTWLSLYSAMAETIRFVAIAIALLTKGGIKSLLINYLIAAFINSSVLLFSSLKIIKKSIPHLPLNSKISLLYPRRKEIIKFLFNTNLNELFTLFTKNIDIMILGYFRNAQEVGFYRLAKNFVNTFGLISNPFYTAIYPYLAKLWMSDILGFKRFIKQVTIFMTSLTMPLALITFITIDWIIKHSAGLAFLPSANLVRIMLLGIIIATILVWTRPAFLSLGRLGTLTLVNFFSAATMFVLSLVIVPSIGSRGSALLFVYPYLIGHLIAIFAFKKILKEYEAPS
ncbi:MAG: oligosaccharide flippase family protein [Candidatus Omnitrophica bacterium]|nr:oligosaccharide flippase family protein [Candidatus Omnitrophota bacterium]